MSASLEGFQGHSGDFRKFLASFIRHMRIVFGVEDHYLRPSDVRSMVPRVVETPAPQLLPVRIGKPITITKRLADVLCIVFLGGFDLFGTIQNPPVHCRAICDHPRHSWVKRSEDAAAPPKLPPMTKILSGDSRKRRPNAISSSSLGKSSMMSRMSSWGDRS